MGLDAGDLVIAAVALDANPASTTWPSGWTESKYLNPTGVALSIAWLTATGGEGSEITIESAVAEKAGLITYRVTGHNSTAPEVSTGATGSSGAIDPDSLTPTWGAKDTLWIAFGGIDVDNVSAAPSSYIDFYHAHASEAGGGQATAVSAHTFKNATDENPGAFTGGDDQWAGVTVAVEPLAGGSTYNRENQDTVTFTDVQARDFWGDRLL
jgi:hypothetical protein